MLNSFLNKDKQNDSITYINVGRKIIENSLDIAISINTYVSSLRKNLAEDILDISGVHSSYLSNHQFEAFSLNETTTSEMNIIANKVNNGAAGPA